MHRYSATLVFVREYVCNTQSHDDISLGTSRHTIKGRCIDFSPNACVPQSIRDNCVSFVYSPSQRPSPLCTPGLKSRLLNQRNSPNAGVFAPV